MASEFRGIRGFGRLRPAERQLCEAAAAGEIAFIGRGKAQSPPRKASGKAIRPALIRFLALGGGAGLPVHARGVRAVGAWIAGDIDLAGSTVRVPLELEACRVTGTIILTGARLASLSLTRSRVGGVAAADLRVSGRVNLASASFDRSINFSRARIGSDLDLSGAAIAGLGLAFATVSGRLVLQNIRVPRGKKDASISLDGVRAGELVRDEKSAKLFAGAPTPFIPADTRRKRVAWLLIALLLLSAAAFALWLRVERKPAVTEPSPPSVVAPKPPIVEPTPPPVVEPKPPILESTPPPVVEPKPPILEPSPPPVVEPKPPVMEQKPPPVVEPTPPPVVEPSPPPVVEPKPPIVEPTPPPVVESAPPPIVEPKPPIVEPTPPPVMEPKPPVVEPTPPQVVEPKPPVVEPTPPPVIESKPPIVEPTPPPVAQPKPPIVEPTPPPVIEPKPPIVQPSPPPVLEPKPPVVQPAPPPIVQAKPPITKSKPPVAKPKRRPVPKPGPAPQSEYMGQCASAHSDPRERA